MGFLAHAASVKEQVAAGTLEAARGARMIFNDRLDAVIAGIFMAVVALVVVMSVREWLLLLSRRKQPVASETPFVESAYAN